LEMFQRMISYLSFKVAAAGTFNLAFPPSE
jgi:hypothetical protein